MLRLVLAGALALACVLPSHAQIGPGPGPQPQPPFTGGTLSQPLILTPSNTGAAGLNVAPGVAPTSPNAGDLWATSSGLFARFGGVTTGPITGAAGTTGQLQTNNSGSLTGITLGGDCGFSTPNIICTKTAGTPFTSAATTAIGTSGATIPLNNTLSTSFDSTFGSTRGSVLERGTAGWQIITPGASGLPWVSNGAGNDPAYQLLTTAGIASATITGGNIASNTVANSNLANMAAGTVKGSIGGGTPADLTGLQAEGVLQFLQNGTGAAQRSLDSWVKANAILASDFVAAGAANAQNNQVTVTITSGTASLTVGTAIFASTDCQTGTGCTGTQGNKVITVGGIGAAGAPLQTTIAGFTSSTHITLGTNAGTSQSAVSEPIVWGTDNTTALQNWLNACVEVACYLDPGRYLVTGTLSLSSHQNLTIIGGGRFTSEIMQANVADGILSYTTTTGFANAQFYRFRLSQYMPQSASVALISLTGGGNAQFASTLVDLMLYGGNSGVFANNVQWMMVDRNTWLNQSVQGMFYAYTLACNIGVVKVENSFVSPISGGGGFNIGGEGAVTFINNDISTQGTEVGQGIGITNNCAGSFGDIFIDNNNLEGWANGINITKGSTVGSGGAVHVSGNDFFTNGIPITIGDANASWLNDVAIYGNHIYCVTTCVSITNSVSNVVITGNTFNVVSGTPTGISIGSTVAGIAKGNTFAGLTTNVVNASPVFYAESIVNGHVTNIGVAPTAATCPGFSPGTNTTDMGGFIAYTPAATTCSITFAHAWATNPTCIVTPVSSGTDVAVAPTTTTMTVTFTSAQTGFEFMCRGN